MLAGPQRQRHMERVLPNDHSTLHRPFDARGEVAERCVGDLLGRRRRFVVGHHPVEHQRVVRRVLTGEVAIGRAAASQVGNGIVGRGCLLHPLAEAAEPFGEELVEHAVLAAEARVDVHRADAGGAGDPTHRQRRWTVARQQVVGGRQQGAARLVDGAEGWCANRHVVNDSKVVIALSLQRYRPT